MVGGLLAVPVGMSGMRVESLLTVALRLHWIKVDVDSLNSVLKLISQPALLRYLLAWRALFRVPEKLESFLESFFGFVLSALPVLMCACSGFCGIAVFFVVLDAAIPLLSALLPFA